MTWSFPTRYPCGPGRLPRFADGLRGERFFKFLRKLPQETLLLARPKPTLLVHPLPVCQAGACCMFASDTLSRSPVHPCANPLIHHGLVTRQPIRRPCGPTVGLRLLKADHSPFLVVRKYFVPLPTQHEPCSYPAT